MNSIYIKHINFYSYEMEQYVNFLNSIKEKIINLKSREKKREGIYPLPQIIG